MTLASMVRQLIEGVMNSARITSASPNFVNRVEAYDWFSNVDNFDDVIRAEVQRILAETQTETKEEESQAGVGTPPAEESEGTNVEASVRQVVEKNAGALQNPIGSLSAGLRSIPLPHAQLVALALAMAPLIFKLLTMDGGALDLRFRRKMQDETNSFLDRQTQRNTQIGLRQVIIQSRAGFIQVNGAGGNENNVRQIREGGIRGYAVRR